MPHWMFGLLLWATMIGVAVGIIEFEKFKARRRQRRTQVRTSPHAQMCHDCGRETLFIAWLDDVLICSHCVREYAVEWPGYTFVVRLALAAGDETVRVWTRVPEEVNR